jgi:D-glycero-D-manno-heptose 1,7-bisphosphate phosphatase
MTQRAIFLDKDGTLVENIAHNADPARIRLMPGVAEGLRALSRMPYRLFIVTNQPGLALGLITDAQFLRLSRSLEALFAGEGCTLSGVYFCPHHPAGVVRRFAATCDCRKPKPGLLRDAAAEHGLDLAGSWMIGDILNDVEAGRRAGCRTVFVDNGNETEWKWSRERRPHVTVHRFDEAVRAIMLSGAMEPAHGALV